MGGWHLNFIIDRILYYYQQFQNRDINNLSELEFDD